MGASKLEKQKQKLIELGVMEQEDLSLIHI